MSVHQSRLGPAACEGAGQRIGDVEPDGAEGVRGARVSLGRFDQERGQHAWIGRRHADLKRAQVAKRRARRGEPWRPDERCGQVEPVTEQRRPQGIPLHDGVLELLLVPQRDEPGQVPGSVSCDPVGREGEPRGLGAHTAEVVRAKHRRQLAQRRDRAPQRCHLVEIPLFCGPHRQAGERVEPAQREERHREGADRREADELRQSARTAEPRCHRRVASEHGDEHGHVGTDGAERLAGILGQRVRHPSRLVAPAAECRVHFEVAGVRGGRRHAVHVGHALGDRDAADHAGPTRIHHADIPAIALEPVQGEEIRLPPHTQRELPPHGAGRGQCQQTGVIGGCGGAWSVAVHATKGRRRRSSPGQAEFPALTPS